MHAWGRTFFNPRFFPLASFMHVAVNEQAIRWDRFVPTLHGPNGLQTKQPRRRVEQKSTYHQESNKAGREYGVQHRGHKEKKKTEFSTM